MATAITVQSKEKIFDAIRKGDKPYWEISEPIKSNVAGKYNVITNNSELDDVNESIDSLREALDGVYGLLLIRISNKPFPLSQGKDLTRSVLMFYLEQSKYTPDRKEPVRGTDDNRSAKEDRSLMDRTLNVYAELSEVKAERSGLKYEIAAKDREIADLKRELAEKESELNECYAEIDDFKEAELNNIPAPVAGNPQEEFWMGAAKELLPVIKPHIGSIISGFVNQFSTNKNNPTILNGMTETETKQTLTEAEREKRTMDALWRLAKIDPDIDSTLTALAGFAEKNPDGYKTYCDMLKMS